MCTQGGVFHEPGAVRLCPCTMRLLVGCLLTVLSVAVGQNERQKKIVCYFGSWSVEQVGEGKFDLDDLDPFTCTHIIYAFADLEEEYGLIPKSVNIDIELEGYKKVTDLKLRNPKLKVLIGTGGTRNGAVTFSIFASDPYTRETIVNSTVNFLKKYNFDGLDLDWQFPAFREGGRKSDKESYVKLAQELRHAFDEEARKTGNERFLLSMVVPQVVNYVVRGYNLVALTKVVDMMNLLGYDFHLPHETSLEHHAPLFAAPDDDTNNENNIDFITRMYLQLGLERHKLIMGIPGFGRTYTLADANETCLGCESGGGGIGGVGSTEMGFLSYRDICKRLKTEKGWTVKRPYPDLMGPYAYKGTIWVCYDDEESVKLKAEYVNKWNLGGVMFWSLDHMDTKGKCGKGRYPLINSAKKTLGLENYETNDIAPAASAALAEMIRMNRVSKFTDQMTGNTEAIHVSAVTPPTMKPKVESTHKLNENEQENHQKLKKIVCYFASWSAVEDKYNKKFNIEDIDPFVCTHIIYAYADVTGEANLVPRDFINDIDKGGYQKITDLKKVNPDLKILIGAVGVNADPDTFSVIVPDPGKRAILVKSAIKFLRNYNFDGLDLEWQYPASPMGGKPSDKESYFKLVQELKEAFVKESNETKRDRLILSMVIPQLSKNIEAGYDIPSLNEFIDFMNFLGYDFHSSQGARFHHHAALYNQPNSAERAENNIDFIVQMYLKLGLDPHKLILGIPAYGSTVTLPKVNTTCPGCENNGTVMPKMMGLLPYKELCYKLQRDEGWTESRPFPLAMGPYAFKGSMWMSYDDEISVKIKAEYVQKMKLGGVMFWSLDQMDAMGKCGKGKFPLIHAAKEVLHPFPMRPLQGSEQFIMIMHKSPGNMKMPMSMTTLNPKMNMHMPAEALPLIPRHIKKAVPALFKDFSAEEETTDDPDDVRSGRFGNINIYEAKRDLIFQDLHVQVTNNHKET